MVNVSTTVGAEFYLTAAVFDWLLGVYSSETKIANGMIVG
jgi:hypothetical protein